MLFLAINKHQYSYFKKLSIFLKNGEVTYPKFSLLGLRCLSFKDLLKIKWKDIIHEKSRERDVKNKYSGFFYKVLVLFELLFFYFFIKCKIEGGNIKTIVMWNGSHRYHRLITSLYKDNKRLVFFENGLLPNTTTCDFKGVNYINSVPRDKGFYLDFYSKNKNAIFNIEERLIPRKTKKVFESIQIPEEYIFVPFQDDRDTQIRSFSPLFKNMRELYSFLDSKLMSEDDIFVIKEHPNSKADYSDLHNKNARIIFANGNNTQDLISGSKAVLTINSTVGLESILLGKNVITCGKAFYNIEGLVNTCVSEKEIGDVILNKSYIASNVKVRESFIYYLKNNYCVPSDWKDPDLEHFKFISRKFNEC